MKDAKQKLEGMKKLTIGVEVEMYDINRDDAATVIARHFGTDWKLATGHGYCYNTHEIKDQKGRVWEITRDSSIHDMEPRKTEMATPVLTYDDIPELQEIIRELRHAGAKSDPWHGCGVHIHIGSDNLTAPQIRNLVNIMAAHESLLIHAVNIDYSRLDNYCRAVNPNFLKSLNSKKPTSLDELEDIWYGSQGDYFSRSGHYCDCRYHMLNLHGMFPDAYYNHTIEFRLFQFDNPGQHYKGGLHAGKLKAYIQLCLAMVQAAIDLKSASPKQPQQENEKYAMRTWLLRLGMIGDEFSTARKALTDRLPGDAAFRHGRKAA